MSLSLPMRLVSTMPSVDSSQVIDPSLPDSEKYQMTLKMTVGDRRVLLPKAQKARMSATQWLIAQIHSSPATKENGARVSEADENSIVISLDRRRMSAAEQLAEQLGFHTVGHMAEDLLRRAVESPELAEKLLFANLRTRPQSETPQKKAA